MAIVKGYEDGSLLSCDCCNELMYHEESYGWYNNTSWRVFWSNLNPSGAIMMDKEIRHNDYCKNCYENINNFIPQLYDVLMLIKSVNKLERNINDRIKNNRAIKSNAGECC